MIGVTAWRGRVEDRAGWRKSTKGCSANAAYHHHHHHHHHQEEEEI